MRGNPLASSAALAPHPDPLPEAEGEEGGTAARPGRWARLLVPALITAVLFAILIGLAVWQLQRLEWKRAILAAIDQAEAAAAIPLPDHPVQFTKVRTTGRFIPGLQARYGADVRDTPTGPVLGSRVIEPLERPGQAPLLVDRGWAPDGPVAEPAGPVSVEGYIRTPDRPGLFSATDDPAKRLFYTLDPAKIGAALGLPREAPFTLVAMGPPDAATSPAAALPRPPNDHLNYALTWFGLALSLLAVFAAYCRKVLTQ